MISTILHFYGLFLGFFPANWHGPISLLLTLLIASAIWQVLRKSGVWLLLLLILVPALIPVVQDVARAIIELLRALLTQAGA